MWLLFRLSSRDLRLTSSASARGLRLQRRLIKVDPHDSRDTFEVDVVAEEDGFSAPRNRCDHAVDHPPGRDTGSSTAAVDANCGIEISGGVELKQIKPQQQSTQIGFPLVVACAGKHLHDDRLGYRDVAVSRDELCQALIDGTASRTVVFDPS